MWVQTLIRFFNKKLEANNNVGEVSMAIRAFGHLAKVRVALRRIQCSRCLAACLATVRLQGVKRFMNEQELAQVLHRLLETSERLYNG